MPGLEQGENGLTLMGLCRKDVIQLQKGIKLGRADDLKVNDKTARLEGMILFGRPRLFGLLGRQPDVFIPWEEVETVGTDVIFVNTELPEQQPQPRGIWHRIFKENGQNKENTK